MDLREAVQGISGFNGWNHADRIRYFAWFQHAGASKDYWDPGDIAGCYNSLSMEPPTGGVHAHIRSLRDQKELLRSDKGYRLEAKVRGRFDAKYGQSEDTTAVDQLLTELPARLSSDQQREYLSEALRCFRVKAWRAAIVMTWNVSYDHLVGVIVAKHLPAFNQALKVPNILGGKKSPVAVRDDFQRWHESDVVEVCRLSHLTSKEVSKVLKDSLEKRNSAAHPSGSIYDKLQTGAFITVLINNAVLKI